MNGAEIIALTSVLSLLILVGGAFGVRAAFQANKNTQTITNYEKSLDSWKERAASAESDRDSCRAKAIAKTAAYATLEQKYRVLSDIVSGKTEITRVGEETRQYWAEVAGRLEAIEGLFASLDPKIRNALQPKRRIIHEAEEPT